MPIFMETFRGKVIELREEGVVVEVQIDENINQWRVFDKIVMQEFVLDEEVEIKLITDGNTITMKVSTLLTEGYQGC